MDIIKKMTSKNDGSSRKFKEMQEQDRLETMLEERKKSSNRRELEKYYKDREEAEVKRQLDIIRKKRNKEAWKSNSILKSGTNILKEDMKILNNGKNSILGNSCNFLSNKKLNNKQQFFKW